MADNNRDDQYAREARIKLQERDAADKANTNEKGDGTARGASHHKRNASLGKKRSGPLARGGSSDPSEDPTAPLGGGLYGWPSDNELDEDEERSVREEPEGAEDGAEPSALRSWGRYFAQNPLLAAACALLVVLAVLGALSLAGIVKGGPAPSEHGQPAKKTKAAGAASRDASLGKAYDAGTLRVSRQKDALSISVVPGGGTYTETAKKGSRYVVLKSGKGDDYASFDSPYSESGARAYGGHLSESLGTNVIVDARPEFDPGKAAASGWVPIAGGHYTVKARDGSFSAGGDYSDTLVGTTTVERTYNETYIRNTTGATHPQDRSFRVRYLVEGDKDLRLLGVALNPTLIGYRVPDGVKSG